MLIHGSAAGKRELAPRSFRMGIRRGPALRCGQPSDVDRVTQRGLGRLVHDLRQRRVGVHGARELLGGGLELQRDAGLGEQLGGVRAA